MRGGGELLWGSRGAIVREEGSYCGGVGELL